MKWMAVFAMVLLLSVVMGGGNDDPVVEGGRNPRLCAAAVILGLRSVASGSEGDAAVSLIGMLLFC